MVKVDSKKCIGCGFCASKAPDVFEIKEDGKAHVKKGAKCKGNDCKEAADGCPVKAITV